MNKQFVTFFFVIVLTASNAQAQFNFGLRAGFNLSRLSEKFEYQTKNFNKFKSGFQIGIVSEYALSDVFTIQPGVSFSTQGGRYKNYFWRETFPPLPGTDGWETCDAIRHIDYLQIPINILYKLDLGGAKLILQTGFYHAFAVNGKIKCGKHAPIMWHDCSERKIRFGYNVEDGEIRPIDFGLGLGAGMQFINIQFGLGYNFGFTNLSSNPKSMKQSLKNDVLTITVTYLFGKKIKKNKTQ